MHYLLRRMGVALALVIVLHPALAMADAAPKGLLQLIAESVVIVRATVSSTMSGPGPGDIQATLDVDKVYAGTVTPPATVLGSFTSDTLHSFETGERVIAFLTISFSGPTTYRSVNGLGGIIELSPDLEAGADALVSAAVAGGTGFSLSDAATWLGTTTPTPRLLVAETLEGLRTTVTPSDGPRIVDMACNDASDTSSMARTWAVERIGDLDPPGGRACIDTLVAREIASMNAGSRSPNPQGRAAIEVIGRFGASANVDGLRKVLKFAAKPSPVDAECGTLNANITAAAHAAGQTASTKVVGNLAKSARGIPDMAFGSTVVGSLAAIGGKKALKKLDLIARTHPEDLVREQAAAAAGVLRKKMGVRA